MKTKIFEDKEKIVYQFSNNDESKEVTYFKCCFTFFANQQVDFDAIAENDFNNWKKYIDSTEM